MRTLFAISILALLALLWASISIASHIRRARKRRTAVPPPPIPEQDFSTDTEQPTQ